MRSPTVILGALPLVLLVMAAAWSVLPACGLRLPFGHGEWQVCPAAAAAPRPTDGTAAQREVVLRQITEAETRLAALECQPAQAPPPAQPALLPQILPQLLRQALPDGPALSPEDLPDDLTALQGCWALSSDYHTVEPGTGASIDFPAWQVRFDGNGKGHETIRESDGISCEGPVAAALNGDQTLVIDEPGDLPCSNGYSIYRRQIRCHCGCGGAGTVSLGPA